MKSFDFNNFECKTTYHNWLFLFRPLLKLLCRIEYIGEENIPENGNFILAVNHISHIDFLMMMGPKRMPPLHFMAMSELFRKPVQGAFMKSLNCFPIKRGNSAISVNYAENLLKNGHCMAMMPEGAINRESPFNPTKARSGIARIAINTNSDILPCSIYCDGKPRLFKKFTVSFGKVIPSSEISDYFEEKESHKETADFIFSKTKKLWKMAGNKCITF